MILPLRERARVRDSWTRERLDTLVPELMRAAGVDAWVIAAREYNEDPVLATMLPATWLSARRRTILAFFDRGGGVDVERLAVSRYAVGELFPSAWNPDEQPDAWRRLAELIDERDPRRIALDTSSAFAHADGLSASERDALLAALSPRHRARVVSAEPLAVGWLERRTPGEMERYPALCRLGHELIREGLSPAVVRPGRTTTEDLVWWYRERAASLGLRAWFQPLVSLQRAEEPSGDASFADDPGARVIRPGDLLHVDVGVEYLGLHTDTQHHAYVPRPGESGAPAGLAAGLTLGNRLQDIVVAELAVGRTGNEVLARARARMRELGITGRIYCHPLGLHGHAAGPAIGLWDQQDGVPGAGDAALHSETVHSIELAVESRVREWSGRRVDFMLEEDAFLDGHGVRFLDGRQEALTLVG